MGDEADRLIEAMFDNWDDACLAEAEDKASRQFYQTITRKEAEMAPRKTTTRKVKKNKIKVTSQTPQKPILVKVGRHYISPSDVRCISEVKKGTLYIIKFYSEPNPEFPCFVKPEDIGVIFSMFNILETEE